ncbi:UNVERIFIED_CONTAM: hypothetical protein FKN15_025408 [Acipenser sinensis]
MDASLALPKIASLASPKDASLALPKDACLASPGAACCSTSPVPACCSASPGAACCSASQQEVLWPEPHQGELPALKKGEEVRRPPTPAAVSLPEIVGEVRRPAPTAALSLQEILWPEPRKRELPATKKGGRSGDHPPSSLSAARTTPAGGARLGTINISADSISAVSWEAAGIATSSRRVAGVCHTAVSIAVDSLMTCGPLEASGPGPGLCVGLLGF